MNEPSIPLLEHDIANDDTLVFLHIPKTAGITLGTLIDPMWLPHSRAPIYLMREFARAARSDVEGAHSFIGHFYLNTLENILARPMFSITLLREPIARYVSAFYQVQREKTPLNPKGSGELQLIRSLSLDEFVWRKDLNRKNAMTDQQTRRIAAQFPLQELTEIPRLMRLENENPQVIPMLAARQKLAALQCFGLTEQFQETLWMLCFIFGWYPLENRVALNQAPKPTRTDVLASETLEQIHELNRKDLNLYTFATSLFQKRYVWLMQTLLERYGNARAQLPLSHETMRELLVKHFHARYKTRHNESRARAIQFAFDENAESATGWHGIERSPRHGAFRWTGPTNFSSLVLPRPADADLQLRFRVLHVLKPASLDALRVSANGTLLKLTRHKEEDGAMLYHVHIPQRIVSAQPFVHLEWQVPETLRPIDVQENNLDERALGIAISWVELTATE